MKQPALIEFEEVDRSYFEGALCKEGIALVAGVDEVGRGCLAGPVLSASVILPRDHGIEGINDSKLLTPKKRDELYDLIIKRAVAYGIGIVGPEEIDRINILQATLKSMKMAVESLSVKPEYLLVDGNHGINVNIPQKVIVKGDSRSVSVGAASIVAKVTRDRMMAGYDKQFPGFSFSVHKGYGTKRHLDEIAKNGRTAIHRMSFQLNSI